MVFLALTSGGLADALRLFPEPAKAVWCGADAISEEEFRRRGLAGVTRFTYSPGASGAQNFAQAVDTIEQHHPGETIWVEGAP